jgi:hypothetical protein
LQQQGSFVIAKNYFVCVIANTDDNFVIAKKPNNQIKMFFYSLVVQESWTNTRGQRRGHREVVQVLTKGV